MSKSNDKCFGALSDADQKLAAEQEAVKMLFMLDGKLKCTDCGQMVGATKTPLGDFFVPSPRPHNRPKQHRPRPLKRGLRK
jgi:hypothetical protein